MNVGEAARRAGLSPKTLRYYDEVGVVSPARAESGYRTYSEEDVHRLRFLGRARRLGFPLERCRTLLSLYTDEARHSREVKRVVAEQVAEIERRVRALESIRDTLERLAAGCRGDDRPECPILDEFGAVDGGVIEAILEGPDFGPDPWPRER